jgi:hypothetical protein
VYNRLRWWLRKEASILEEASCSAGEKLMLTGLRDWKRMPLNQKGLLVKFVIESTQPPDVVCKFLQNQWPDDSRPAFLNTASVLLTYNGEWGVLESLPPEMHSASIKQIVDWVLADEPSLNKWQKFEEFAQTLHRDLHLESWTAAFEFCVHTWESEGILRLHAHVYLKSQGRMRVASDELFAFLGTKPHRSAHLLGGAQRACSGAAGHYYLNSPKVSSVWVASNKKPFVDYLVSPQWIWNMVQAEKMHYEAARLQFVRCGRYIRNNLSDLDQWKLVREQQDVEARVESCQALIRQGMVSFRHISAVSSWFSKFASGVHARKPFLVLVGPSGTGKTMFARSLFPPGSFLELNCAGIKSIHLSGFSAKDTRGILWDEISAPLIAANRKVFQHPCAFVDLGHSPTGQHIKKYWLGDCVSIVATNVWNHELAVMPSHDRDWLVANSVVVPVDTPLWEANSV